MKKIKFALLLVFVTTNLVAQNKSNKGKEFWLGYGYSWNFNNESNPNTQDFILYLTADAPANVTVSITNTSWSQTVSIPANTVNSSIIIPKTGANDARIFVEGLHNKNIHIVSDTPIVVYAHMYNGLISAATMLMPVETYGYKNYSLNYSQATSGSSLPTSMANFTQNGPDWYSYFFVIASEDNTRLEITPSDTTRNGWLPNQTYTVNLNKGELYNVMGKLTSGNALWQASKDMTGSKVISIPGADGKCHPVAMFSGSSGIRLCKNDGGENMLQQVFPAQAWGTKYLTYHTLNNGQTDILEPFKNFYRVAVTDPTTVVRRNGTVLTGLINNFYYELVDSIGGDFIESNKPILLAQYTPNFNSCWKTPPSPGGTYGDPEMFYLSPMEQGQKDILFYANRKAFIDFNYVNVILPTQGLSTLRLNGNPFVAANTRVHPNNSAYSVAVARITGPAGQHRLTCDSAFIGTMYGLGFYESYGYNIGCNINNLNTYGGVRNTLSNVNTIDTVSCKTTPLRLFIKLANPATSINWKLSQVQGINPNVDVLVNAPTAIGTENINGRTYYVYTLSSDYTFANIGKYKIPVVYTTPDIGACSNTEEVNFEVVIKEGPKPNFNFPAACPNQTISLTGVNNANGFNLVNYTWDFPDGTSQSTVNAIKSFPSIGTYNVRYRIFADNGCVGDTTKPLVIGSPLTAILSGFGKACVDSVFTFTSSLVQDPTNMRTWHWDFGDGVTTTTTTNTTSHSYAALNVSRTVKHAVSFAVGCNTDTATFIVPAIKVNPTASFSVLKDTLCVGTNLLFTSTLGNVNKWSWNFGNGSSNNAPPLFHKFSTAGQYDVKLIITDTNGCGSLPASEILNISPKPLVNAGDEVFINPGNTALLNATVSPVASYMYSWSPASTLNLPNILQPIAKPIETTTYYLFVENPITKCTGTDSVTVKIITKIYVPNAFSTSVGALNKVWRIPGIEQYPNSLVTVYDRYGQKVYESNNNALQPWNGKIKGTDAPQGAYVYIIRVNNETKDILKGTVLLIR
jgi:gliding motility-associated-like protein